MYINQHHVYRGIEIQYVLYYISIYIILLSYIQYTLCHTWQPYEEHSNIIQHISLNSNHHIEHDIHIESYDNVDINNDIDNNDSIYIHGHHVKLSLLSNTTTTSNGILYGPINMYGCPSKTFWTTLTLGTTDFNMVVDTGSSTTAVAGSSCQTCPSNVSPLYNSQTSSTSQYIGTYVTSKYGDGSTW